MGAIRSSLFMAAAALLAAVAQSCAAAGESPSPAAKPAAGVAADAVTLLTQDSPWRWTVSWRRAAVTVEALKAAGKTATEPALLPNLLGFGVSVDALSKVETPPPPAGWQDAGFDDAAWPRWRGPFKDVSLGTGLLCLRGRFAVTDPAAVKSLNLTLGYRGGAIVYLNGREVARTDMPEGPVKPESPASPYPNEAFVDAAGKTLLHSYKTKNEEDKARIAKRDRRFGPADLTLPAGLLRRGVNVLAVELHRSDYHPVALTWWTTSDYLYWCTPAWAPIGLNELRLSAVGAGAVPNLDRPRGIQLWTLDLHDRLQEADWADPQGEGGPHAITMAGARNGTYSGAVALSSAEAIKGARAAVSDLAQDGGAGRIPASAVQVRFVVTGVLSAITAHLMSNQAAAMPALDGLVEQPPAAVQPEKRGPSASPAALLPIWVTVRVPNDAAPGKYQGKLTVSAEGFGPTEIPVGLSVAGWTVPNPQNFRTQVTVYQSPPSLALYYKVPEWSEEHWKHVEKSLELLGRVGNDMIVIPILERTQFGNDEGMIYWVKKPDGSYSYDFTVFDRYIKLARKHLGTPSYVALQVWHTGGSWTSPKADQEAKVTTLEADGKTHGHMQVPVYATEEAKKFWAALVVPLKEHLAKEGMDKSMCWGILSDGQAPPEVFKMFNEVAPGIGWSRGCHTQYFGNRPYAFPLGAGAVEVIREFCYGMSLKDPDKQMPRIYDDKGLGVAYLRSDFDKQPLILFRLTAERALYHGLRGFGRCCLDSWSIKDERGKYYNLYNRWPNSSCMQREPTVVGLAYPGADGPRASIRYELVIEGLQEAEAMIVIAEALDTKAERLGPELADRCRRLFRERVDICRQICPNLGDDIRLHYAGWQDRSRRLYETAAEVAAKLGR